MNKAELIQLIRDNLPLLKEVSSYSEAKDFIDTQSVDEEYILILKPNTKLSCNTEIKLES